MTWNRWRGPLDPRYFWVLHNGLVWAGASYAKYHLMQQKGSVWWRIRWNVGFEIPIITFWELVESAAGSIGPRTVFWRLNGQEMGALNPQKVFFYIVLNNWIRTRRRIPQKLWKCLMWMKFIWIDSVACQFILVCVVWCLLHSGL